MTIKHFLKQSKIRFMIAILFLETILFTFMFLIVFMFSKSLFDQWFSSIINRTNYLSKQNTKYSSK